MAKKLISNIETAALSEWLTEWPEGLTFSQVLDRINEGDDEVVIWAEIEYYPSSKIIELIETTRNNIDQAFKRQLAEAFPRGGYAHG